MNWLRAVFGAVRLLGIVGKILAPRTDEEAIASLETAAKKRIEELKRARPK